MTESHKRSIVKAITWRFLATLTTMILVFIFTGSLALAGSIGIFDVIIKLMVYYSHERAWNRISWGKHLLKSFKKNNQKRRQSK